ncbi:MAG: beta-glucosidase, partial [Phenylobacterium sp.]
HLVMDILKGEWGYQGVLLTDWNVDINTRDAAMFGLDLEMGTEVDSYDDYFLAKPLLQLIKAGDIPVAVLDDKVRRILRVQQSIGMMDKNRQTGQRNSPQHQADARKIATEGIVLLKNSPSAANHGQPVLPLDRTKLKNILVLGPNADKKHGLGGGSSEVKSLYEITPLQGLKDKLGDKVNITVMRARSKTLAPIASDYLASRHWTGTAAWNIAYYADEARTKLLSDSWIVDSQYQSVGSKGIEHITMKGTIKPLQSGEHRLKVSANGVFRLKVNGETVISLTNQSQQNHNINLKRGEAYGFEIQYDGNQQFTLGWDAPGNLFSSEAEYLAAAKNADAVIYFGGLSHADDRESIDRTDMKLPNSQDEIISKLLAVNQNTVVFMIAGSAVEMPWSEQANALVWGWYGGMEAGHAFADMLLGDANPGGKMPITLPARLADTAPIALDDYNAVESLYKEGVFIGYRWFEQQNIAPLFSFGHGLSYSQFDFSDIQLSSDTLRNDEVLTVTAMIKNVGKVAGSEVVQLYLHDKHASVKRPIKELKGFSKVFLQPGESQPVSITLNKRDLSFWDINSNDWLAEPGDFEVMLGSSVSDIKLKRKFNYRNK